MGSKLTAWSQKSSGCAEGQYGVDGPYCDVAADLAALQPKNRLLEHCRFGGASTLFSLTTYPKDICRNLVPWKQHLCQIWCLQCTFMTDLINGLYKKTPGHGKITFCGFTVELMSVDQELQKLLREFERTGL